MLDVLEKDVAYSNKIIIDLLDYSRKLQIAPVETRLKPLLEQSLQITPAPTSVTVQEQAEDLWIMVDPQIQRVFINLIKNAYDAMPDGGQLSISTKTLEKTVQINFTDTGTGIPEEVTEKLWKGPVTTKAKGLGMGLAISKRIVEAHGGSLVLERNLGRGTTVRVNLPINASIGGE